MITTNRAFGDNKVTYLTYCPFKVLYLLTVVISLNCLYTNSPS